MTTKRVILPLSILAVVVAVFFYFQPRTVAQAPGPVGRFTVAGGTYKFADSPELSTTIRMDSVTGQAWFLRIRKDNNGVNVVEWFPMGVFPR